MDYEKAYKEALERARKSHDKANGFIKKEWIETIFPELKESEDEKIREEIIKNIRQDIEIECTLSEDEGNRWIAWLEKQGEQNSADSYCQENCKGYKETGKCFADGKCKAKRDSERSNIVERLTAFAVHLQKRGAFRDDLCMDFEHEAQSFIESQKEKRKKS